MSHVKRKEGRGKEREWKIVRWMNKPSENLEKNEEHEEKRKTWLEREGRRNKN